MVALEAELCSCLVAAEAEGALSALSVLREFLICRLFELFHSKLALILYKLSSSKLGRRVFDTYEL